MASPDRQPANLVALAERLAREAKTGSFRPLLSLLERLLPTNAPVGGTGPVGDETIRLRHDPSLTFSAGDVARVTLKQSADDPEDFRARGRPYFEVTTTFLGLTGSATPMPYYLAEEVAQEDPAEPHRRDFLDLFHHRLLALLYRALAKYDLASDHTLEGTDVWSKRVLSLAGLDAHDGPPKSDFPVWRLLRLSPLLAGRVRNARVLEAALTDVLSDVLDGTPVRIRELTGGFAAIAPEQRTRLGRANTQLGRSAVLGSRVLDRSGAFEVHLGPVSFEVYRRFLPGGDLPRRVASTVALFTREPLEHVLKVQLRPESVPRLQLTRERRAGLGRDTWLGHRGERTTVVTVRGHPV